MKRILASWLVFFLTFFIMPSPSFAHLIGQPPYFKINGSYANLYPVPLTSLSDFNLPQDMAPSSYLINQTLNFELDITRLPAPPDVVKKTQFTWDFGDGVKAEGLATSHNYSKMGSYFLTVNAFDGTTPAPQLLESVLINILPNSQYQLPQAVIKINGQQSRDPLVDVLEFPLGQNLHFDATSSTAHSAQIVSYFWDYGDQQSSTQPISDHYFPKDLTQIFPVLRVKDSNGFLADNFVEIQNQQNALIKSNNLLDNQKTTSVKTGVGAKSSSQLPIVLGVLAGILVIVFTVRRLTRVRGRGKHQ